MIIEGSKVFLEELAWDAGYGANKIVCQSGVFNQVGGRQKEFYTKVSYPSYYCIWNSSKALKSVVQHNGISLEKLIINYKNTDYAIGQFAVVQSPAGTKQIFDKDKFKSEGEIAKLLAGMAYVFPDYEEIHLNKLIVGLSLESFVEFKKEIESFYQNRTFDFMILHTGKMKPMKVVLKEVSCRVQGNGAFFDKFFEMNEYGDVLQSKDATRMKHFRFAIIDPGAKTVDSYLSEGSEPIAGTECVMNYGISNIYRTVSEKLGGFPEKRLEHTYLTYINPDVPAVEKRPDLYWAKKNYMMSYIVEICNRALADLGVEIAQRLKHQWNEHLDLVELIILCGGGANSKVFVDAFRSQFDIPIEVSFEPQFANAFGYLKAAKFERVLAEWMSKKKNG